MKTSDCLDALVSCLKMWLQKLKTCPDSLRHFEIKGFLWSQNFGGILQGVTTIGTASGEICSIHNPYWLRCLSFAVLRVYVLICSAINCLHFNIFRILNLISWASQMWFGYPKCLCSSCLGYLRISLFMLKTGLLRDERLSSSPAMKKVMQ